MNAQWENFEVVTTACSACGVGTESTNMLCEECDADADDEAEMQDAYDMEQELYYDRPNVIAAEVFEDRLSTYRNEH